MKLPMSQRALGSPVIKVAQFCLWRDSWVCEQDHHVIEILLENPNGSRLRSLHEFSHMPEMTPSRGLLHCSVALHVGYRLR